MLMITHHVEELSPQTAKVALMRRGRSETTGTPDEAVTDATACVAKNMSREVAPMGVTADTAAA